MTRAQGWGEVLGVYEKGPSLRRNMEGFFGGNGPI